MQLSPYFVDLNMQFVKFANSYICVLKSYAL